MSKSKLFLFTFLLLFDQITKLLVRKFLVYGKNIVIIKDIFQLNYTKNPSIALGLLDNVPNIRWVLVFVSTILLVILFLYYKSLPNNKENKNIKFGVFLIFCGAIGNLIERIFIGEVTDFLFFSQPLGFFIFNFADVYISLGVAIYILNMLFFMPKDK